MVLIVNDFKSILKKKKMIEVWDRGKFKITELVRFNCKEETSFTNSKRVNF